MRPSEPYARREGLVRTFICSALLREPQFACEVGDPAQGGAALKSLGEAINDVNRVSYGDGFASRIAVVVSGMAVTVGRSAVGTAKVSAIYRRMQADTPGRP